MAKKTKYKRPSVKKQNKMLARATKRSANASVKSILKGNKKR